ncbi:MAG: trypsin-like peptidase domain-containing protein [Bacteroidota bacterium]
MKQFLSLLAAAALGGILGGGLVYHQIAAIAAPTPVELMEQAPTSARLVSLPAVTDLPSQLAAPTFDFSEAAHLVTPAVVHIQASVTSEGKEGIKAMFDRNSPLQGGGEGSGVIYTSNGYVLTNHHVIEGTNKVEVTLNNNSKYAAEIVGYDEKTDIAVLKIEGENFPYLELADSDLAEIGQWVLAVGNPLDLNSTVTAGIISAKGRSIELIPGRDAIESFIQTDAAVNPGNSGGPLVDAEGRLLGINTAIATRTGLFQGYSFAIPINLVQRIADDIIETGSFRRVFLGVDIYSLDAESAANLGVNINQGVVIEAVQSGSSAAQGSLQAGDIVVEINGRTVRSLPDLTEIIGRSRIGDVLEIKVYRDQAYLDLAIEMLESVDK